VSVEPSVSIDITSRVLRAVQAASQSTGRVIVAVAGPVAVGKTTFADHLARAVGGQVVSTDGFLMTNAELESKGLIDRKGFPESYDTQRLHAFLREVRTATSVPVHQYAHDVFDINPIPVQFAPGRVTVIEGINALQGSVAELADVRIYLDAEIESVIEWFTNRFVGLTDIARETGKGFYLRFAEQSPEQLRATARWVWDTINAPNVDQHIAPTKRNADIVLTKAADHSFEQNV
jgi:type I pantothenate kinase